MASVQALDKSMSSRKKGNASLYTGNMHPVISGVSKYYINTFSIKPAPPDLLEASELFAEEVNDHDAEDEAGEHGEESSDACNTPSSTRIR